MVIKPTEQWLKQAALDEENYDISAGKEELGMAMEKLGIEGGDLIKELKDRYQSMKVQEASLIKTGAAKDAVVVSGQLKALAEKIDELEARLTGVF